MPKFVLQRNNVATGDNEFQGTTTFTGAVTASGGITGDLTGNAITVTVADSTDASSSVAIFDSATGNLAPKTDAGLTYNASTGTLTATAIATNNITGGNVVQKTITDVDAQNATPTAAQIVGGIVTHNSKTGAGTVTVPLGADMSAGVTGATVGTTIKWLYYNRGNQTATITAATGHTLIGGTAAVTTGKHMEILTVCTGTDTWVSYLQTLM